MNSEFSVTDKGDAIVITLPKENLSFGLQATEEKKITNSRKFYAAFVKHFLHFDEDETGDSAFIRFIEDLAIYLVEGDDGIEMINTDWEDDFS